MNTLIIQLPIHQRHVAGHPSSTTVLSTLDKLENVDAVKPLEYAYVLVHDQHIISQGYAVPTSLPGAEEVVLVIDALDLGWHRLTLPKAPPARLRQALRGILEEQLLSDPQSLHLALAPGAKTGQLVWVAACHHGWLTNHLKAFENAHVRIDRVVPAMWPDNPETAFFREVPSGSMTHEQQSTQLMVTWATSEGVGSWPLAGSMARFMLPEPLPMGVSVLATPSAVAFVEHWLEHPVQAQSQAERCLVASKSPWNLLQFELIPKSKGVQALADHCRKFMGPDWRSARWGLISLLLTQVICLNAWSWQQQHTLKTKRAEMAKLLQATYPQIQAVLDPVLQMRSATDALRGASGQTGPDDLEFLMRVLASAWAGDNPVKGFIYDGSSLDVGVPDFWQEDEINACANRLRQMGMKVERNDRQLRFRRSGADA